MGFQRINIFQNFDEVVEANPECSAYQIHAINIMHHTLCSLLIFGDGVY
jgi:hypothetical protein